jgi:CRISPR/Cas system-associated exonuclease Cas4 (RecB family)
MLSKITSDNRKLYLKVTAKIKANAQIPISKRKIIHRGMFELIVNSKRKYFIMS